MSEHDILEASVPAPGNSEPSDPIPEPRGPVPAPCPQGGHSPTRPSSTAGAAGPAVVEGPPRNRYESRQDARRERLLAASASAEAKAGNLHARARSMASMIPLGQPILVGHHSEGRDRRYRDRIGGLYQKSFEAESRAKDLRGRAAAVGTGGISSDDPDALAKLRTELAAVESQIARMKAVNLAHARYLKNPTTLDTAPITDADKARCRGYEPPYSWEPHPFAPFQLTNAGANARRIQKRIKDLEVRDATPVREPLVGEGWMIDENTADNRISITFDAIPGPAVRVRLKAAGFRWSPTRGAWVRRRSNAAWAAATYAMEELR